MPSTGTPGCPSSAPAVRTAAMPRSLGNASARAPALPLQKLYKPSLSRNASAMCSVYRRSLKEYLTNIYIYIYVYIYMLIYTHILISILKFPRGAYQALHSLRSLQLRRPNKHRTGLQNHCPARKTTAQSARRSCSSPRSVPQGAPRALAQCPSFQMGTPKPGQAPSSTHQGQHFA